MPAIILKGAIVVVSVVGAAAIAISQIPEVRAFGQDCRRKLAIALHNLGDDINPNRPQQPRFNRPEDAEGFMQSHGAEVDADEESRRRQREELMYWNAIKLENLEKQKAKENQSKGPTFDDILRKHSVEEEGTYATKTGVEIQEGTLRHRGESSRGIDRGSLYANPFADENHLDSDGDAKMIGPEDDEMEDIYTDNDLRDGKKPAPDNRVLAAASDYPLGEHYTMQLQNFSEGIVEAHEDQSAIGDQSHPRTGDSFMQNYMLGLEQENEERLMAANLAYPELQSEPTYSEPPSTSNATILEPPRFYSSVDQRIYPPIAADSNVRHQPSNAEIGAPPSQLPYYRVQVPATHQGNSSLQDYQMQLMLLEQQKKRRVPGSLEQGILAPQAAFSENESTTSAQTTSSQATHQQNRQQQDYQMQLMLLEQQNKQYMRDRSERGIPAPQFSAPQYMAFSKNESANSAETTSNPTTHQGRHQLQDYQMQLMLLEQQNKKRLMMARQEQDISDRKVVSKDESTTSAENISSPTTLNQEENEQLVDVSEPSSSPKPQALHENTMDFLGNTYQNPNSESRRDNSAFASIHAWADNSNASFYSPLPGTPRAPSSAAPSEPDHLSRGDITPTDTLSLAGSGEDVGNDSTSSVGGGRYYDVVSMDGSISTPGTWTEVGSVVSEDDSSQH